MLESQMKSEDGIGISIGVGNAAETDDEGIERDSGDVSDEPTKSFFTLKDVMEVLKFFQLSLLKILQ